MKFVIKILLIISFTNLSLALDDMRNEDISSSNTNSEVDFNDPITQEIDNYNNNIASEILDDEHDSSSNNNITSKNITLNRKSAIKQELKYALLTVLNKITAKNESFFLEVDKVYKYKNISLIAFSCQKSENNEFEDRVLIKITEDDSKNDDHTELFSGWLLTKSSLTTLTHPIYDITLTECAASNK